MFGTYITNWLKSPVLLIIYYNKNMKNELLDKMSKESKWFS